jgi:hypothetical protein
VKVKERVKGKEVESESERACDFTDAFGLEHRKLIHCRRSCGDLGQQRPRLYSMLLPVNHWSRI